MGIIEFFVVVFVVAAAAGVTVWAIKRFIPSAPPFFVNVVWGAAVIVILVLIASVLGLTGIDPRIPRLR